MRAVDPAGMRRQNMALTLRALVTAGHGTLAELASMTGLSRQTTEIILEALCDDGFARETPWETHRDTRPVGRPARVFEFVTESALAGAMFIAPDHVQVGIANLTGHIVAESTVETDRSSSRADRLDAAQRCYHDALARGGWSPQQVKATTVATVGPVRDNGEVDLRMTLPEWTGFSLSEALQTPLGCPVFVENDVKLGAVGERWKGAAQGVDNLIWIWNSDGRSGIGMVIGGQLYRGLDGRAGEIVWADNLGFDGLRDSILSSAPSADSQAEGSQDSFLTRARAGESAAVDDVTRVVDQIQLGVETLVWTLAPEMLVLGPVLDQAADLIVPQLVERLARKNQSLPEIVGSTLGSQAIIYGAVRRSLDHIEHLLFDPMDPATSVPA